MPHKGPHISLPSQELALRVLALSPAEIQGWPESVRELALAMAEELFLVRYNPFVDPHLVMTSVRSSLRQARRYLAKDYIQVLSKCMKKFWKDFEEDQRFKKELVKRLSKELDPDSIELRPGTLVESATDATDLRMALPLMVLSPKTTEQIRFVVRLANEMGFSLVPRGGGSGLTGGAIPGHPRSVILSLSKLKKILKIDPKEMVLCAQAGVITLNAIEAAANEHNLLLTVDPASKSASSLGGNISENSGGPFAFEYGTTLDNIHSFRMVTPTAEIIEVARRDHPRHKILPAETAIFDILDEFGNVIRTIELKGDQIRGKDLGKDVTNKYLGGLPGVQKEGVDGIITEACFTLHKKPRLSRTLCLEFFGRSMKNAMFVIKDLVGLRDQIRAKGDLVKLSALEEFGIKYVRAIDYVRKSTNYEGEPNSVLLLQLDSDNEPALEEAVQNIVDIASPYENVDVFTAKDQKEADLFWEDRHKLSAISKRTSGFKINEDVVIPIEVIPEFSDFIEDLNLTYMAKAYRKGLNRAANLIGEAVNDEFLEMERAFTSTILKNEISSKDLNDAELEVQTSFFFHDLRSRYPKLEEELEEIYQDMLATRIIIANHMHAGDGNCHVNLPVNSNDPAMMALAEEAAAQVFERVLELNGQVSGEHGIGITKIRFLSDEKIAALTRYKQEIDPKNVLNPGKLTRRDQPLSPYTFSFNRLIQDIRKSGLPEKERLMSLLQHIQICTRCGKCKQVCPMFHPESSLLFHPRNKNISLGALIEAIYYSQVTKGEPDKGLLVELRRLMEHCTACGKCTAVCPVKINTPDVTLHLRAFLEDKQAGGHPIKHAVLNYLVGDPARRVPKAAKGAAMGQSIQNRVVGLVPSAWRSRFKNPLLTGKGPVTGLRNLGGILSLDKGSIFLPANKRPDPSSIEGEVEAVFYFPGCGASLFYSSIGLAAISLLLDSGMGVVLPREHLCCGYPLLVSGAEEAFTTNQARNIYAIKKLLEDARSEGVRVRTLLTSCGSCRDGLARYQLDSSLRDGLVRRDVLQYVLERYREKGENPFLAPAAKQRTILYHASCHAEWSDVPGAKAAELYRQGLSELTGESVRLSPGCCGESGLGALTSPDIYNKIRDRKRETLETDLRRIDQNGPVIVGCPSCKIGISRNLMNMNRKRTVLHGLEYLALLANGPKWKKRIKRAARAAKGAAVRLVDMG